MVELYFELRNETLETRNALANRVETAVANIPLDTDRQFQTAVALWLSRITGTPKEIKKRRRTAQVIAESSINPSFTKDSVFQRKDIVSKTVFYDAKKSWIHDQDYRFAVEVLVAIHRKWDSTAALREVIERQRQWRELEYSRANHMYDVSGKMITKMNEMMDTLQLTELEVQGENGETIIIKPVNVNMGTVAQFGTAVAGVSAQGSKLARMSLGMDTDQQAVNVQAEVAETDTAAIRESMKDKLRQIGIGLKRPSPAEEPVKEGKANEQ